MRDAVQRQLLLKNNDVGVGNATLPLKRTDILVSTLLIHLSCHDVARMPTLQSCAESLNLSLSHIRHIVKQNTGVSFSRLIKRLRLRRARQLLEDTWWSVKQVMVEVGMADHSHFSKDYKREFGESSTYTRAIGYDQDNRAI